MNYILPCIFALSLLTSCTDAQNQRAGVVIHERLPTYALQNQHEHPGIPVNRAMNTRRHYPGYGGNSVSVSPRTPLAHTRVAPLVPEGPNRHVHSNLQEQTNRHEHPVTQGTVHGH